jgi:hypothetical protein
MSWHLMDYTLRSGAFGSRAILWRIGHINRSAVFAATLCDEASGLWAYCGDLCELGRVFLASIPLYRCFEWRLDILKHQHGLLYEWWANGCSIIDRSDEFDLPLPRYRQSRRWRHIEDAHEFRASSANPSFRSGYLSCYSPSSSVSS